TPARDPCRAGAERPPPRWGPRCAPSGSSLGSPESRTRRSWPWLSPPVLDRAARGRGALSDARPAAREPVELLHMVALLEARLIGDAADAREVRKVLVHRVHAVLRAGLHRRIDLVRLALANEVANRRCRDHDLRGDGAAGPVGAAAQRLTYDTLEGVGE